MLKVVGASWEQTRVSTYLLVAFCLFGLVIIIFGGSANDYQEDGNYAATVFWKKEVGYRIEFWGQGNVLEEVPLGSARGYYRQDIAQAGWSKVEIETSPEYPDLVQAYSAGLLEGSLTWQLVYWRWRNTIGTVCDSNPDACDDIRNRLNIWGERMRSKAEELANLEPFWHQVHLFFVQMDGLTTGWNYAVKRNGKRHQHVEIEDNDFLWLNLLATDVPLPDSPIITPRTPSLSSSIIRLHQVNKTAQVLAAQATAKPYRDMLRIVKRYVFHYRLTSTDGAGFVPGSVLAFTGYPGALSSQDDLYSVNSKINLKHSLLVMGTAIGYGAAGLKEPKRVKKRRNVEERVPGSLRGIVACRLARDGRTWAAHFSRGRGGASVDKQWSIVDISKIDNIESDGLLWIIEQSKGVILASDRSDSIREDGYWASFGLPYHQEIRLAMNLSEEYDSLHSYKKSLRGQAFESCKKNCTTVEEVFQLIRNAVPAGEDLLGSRSDLYKHNPTAFGVIDTKIVTVSRDQGFNFDITAGPVHSYNASSVEEAPEGAVSPFQWSISAFFNVTHQGHPDIWSYPSTTAIWAGY